MSTNRPKGVRLPPRSITRKQIEESDDPGYINRVQEEARDLLGLTRSSMRLLEAGERVFYEALPGTEVVAAEDLPRKASSLSATVEGAARRIESINKSRLRANKLGFWSPYVNSFFDKYPEFLSGGGANELWRFLRRQPGAARSSKARCSLPRISPCDRVCATGLVVAATPIALRRLADSRAACLAARQAAGSFAHFIEA